MDSERTWDDVEEELGVKSSFKEIADSLEEELGRKWSESRMYQAFLYNEGLQNEYFGTIDELLIETNDNVDDLVEARREITNAYRDVRQSTRETDFGKAEDYVPGIAVSNDLEELVEDSFNWLQEVREFYDVSGKDPKVTAAAAVYASAESRFGDSEKYTMRDIVDSAGEDGVSRNAMRRRIRNVRIHKEKG